MASYVLHHSFNEGETNIVSKFQNTLEKKELRLDKEMSALAKQAETQNYYQLFVQKPDYYNSLLEDEGIALLIYENDSLKFWSDNSIAVENWIKEVCLDSRMAKLRNGWFEVMKPETNAKTAKTIVGLILIKNEFPYQNKYLTNEFQDDFSVPEETKLITDHPNARNQIKNLHKENLFSLQLNTIDNTNHSNSYFALLFNSIAIMLLVVFIRSICLAYADNLGKTTATFLFAFIIIILRYITIKFSVPEKFYDFELFSPKIYGDASSVWLSSLGDLLLNTSLLFYISFHLLSLKISESVI